MSDKKTTYREHTDMENTLKLRQVLATLPPFCKDISGQLTRPRLPKQEFLMHMTFEFFSSFFWMKILHSKIMP